MGMSTQVWVEQALCVVSDGVVSYKAGRVQRLHALQFCEVGLLEVFELYGVNMMSVVVPMI